LITFELAATICVGDVSSKYIIPPWIVVSIFKYAWRDESRFLSFQSLNSFAPNEHVARSLNSFADASVNGSPLKS